MASALSQARGVFMQTTIMPLDEINQIMNIKEKYGICR